MPYSKLSQTLSSNHLEIHRYNHNPDSFHVHLKTLPLSKLLASSRLLKNDSRYILRITLTGSIANAKFSVQCLNQALSVGDWWRQTGSNRRPLLAKQVLSQLSYAPMSTDLPQVLPPDNGGSGWIRTNDPALSRRCSNRLSYRPLSLSLNLQPISVSAQLVREALERR